MGDQHRTSNLPMRIDVPALIAAADLPAIVGRTVRLRKAGARHYGQCPMHNEKTGSFVLDPDGGWHYHCYGCGAHGSVIDWVQWRDRCGFKDACRTIAAELGLDGPRMTAEKRRPVPTAVRRPDWWGRPPLKNWANSNRVRDRDGVIVLDDAPDTELVLGLALRFPELTPIWYPEMYLWADQMQLWIFTGRQVRILTDTGRWLEQRGLDLAARVASWNRGDRWGPVPEKREAPRQLPVAPPGSRLRSA